MDTTFLLNNILKSDGTNQGQRLLHALNPASILVDERGIKELLNYIYQLSRQINYFNVNDEVDGDWSDFFNYFVDATYDEITLSSDAITSAISQKNDFDPHFALLLTFIKLFSHLQDDINTISKRRLDFYLTKVLQLQQKAAVPDKVNLILELAKNLPNHLVPAGTQFKAKNADGKTLIYQTDDEIVINKAQIASLKSMFLDANDNYKIYTAPVANSADGMGKPFTGTGSKWNAFGESQQNKPDSERNMQEAGIGFAFSSPMLLLDEGSRALTLTINFLDTGEDLFVSDITSGVLLYITGEKGWITLTSCSAVFQNKTQLTINASLSSAEDGVVPFSPALHNDSFNTVWPVLKIVLKPDGVLYQDLYNLQITSADIAIAVTGVKNFTAQTDQAAVDITKPFLPFGPAPTINSAFYLGSAEVFQKKLKNFSLDITWNGVPQADLIDYYGGYKIVNPMTNLAFTARISLLYNDKWLLFQHLFGGVYTPDYSLFQAIDATQPGRIEISQADFNTVVSQVPEGYTRNTALQQIAPLDNKTHNGFIRLELSGPLTPFKVFGHAEYPSLYTNAAILLATNPGTPLPNTPYTPSIKSLSLNYTSEETIDITNVNSPDQFFHVGPFGTAPVQGESKYLLPQFRSEALLPELKADSQLYLGNFFIGLNNLVPPQNISIQFQIAEGSAGTDDIIADDDIEWSYLSNNTWKPFDELNIITNTTQGLQTPGIISFAVGADATNNNTLMPAGLYWLRGSTPQDPAGISEMIDMRTQAVEASFAGVSGADQTTTHTDDMLLAANSISELVVKDSAVKSIQQPYESFAGKPQESDTVFYARVSERLKHKKRALSLWDYERLILDEFPDIFKVKCLTHTDAHTDLQPGSVRAVVVPDLINKNSPNPLEPRVNAIKLTDIENYINNYLPVFVDFKANNPVYEQLLVDCKVGFMPGKDAGYYGNLLNEEIKEFLSPWAYEKGQDITFGGKVFKSDILFFIENRDYVDFVNDFKLYHIFDGTDSTGPGIGTMAIGIDFIIAGLVPPGIDEMIIGADFVVGVDTEVAAAALPQSILVSADNHRITVLNSGDYQCSGIQYEGIDFMSVGIDFIVA
ncbi:hypothetical protein [Parafilimonas sp.]|uniref:hypothetical protein n=1 Tax=Parafilimonas sp. TaxID=1969739 RepID=UPI0039E54843